MPTKEQNYTREEDEIILRFMRGLKNTYYSGSTKRYKFISKNYLPHRSPAAIQQRWYILTERRIYNKERVKDLVDLLSPEQRKRVRVRLPSFKSNFDPRMMRKP